MLLKQFFCCLKIKFLKLFWQPVSEWVLPAWRKNNNRFDGPQRQIWVKVWNISFRLESQINFYLSFSESLGNLHNFLFGCRKRIWLRSFCAWDSNCEGIEPEASTLWQFKIWISNYAKWVRYLQNFVNF